MTTVERTAAAAADGGRRTIAFSLRRRPGLLQRLSDAIATRSSVRTGMYAAATTAVAALYDAHYMRRGWFPADDGMLGQSALRVLQGQLPHRDFDEVYTGALTYMNAIAFKLLGVELASLRYVLLVFFVAWVPVFFYVATRFASARVAAAITLLAVAWSVPNYPASMPSWYTLFFATFASAALLRYVERPRARWLFVAGLAAGCSMLIKVVGVYEIAAIGVFLVYRHQTQRAELDRPPTRRERLLSLVVLSVPAALVLFVVALVRPRLTSGGIADFVIPVVAVAAFLAWNELRTTRAADLRGLLGMLAPVAAGIALPIGAFLVPYVLSGSVSSLVDGVFVAPTSRIELASYDPPGPVMFLALLPLALIVAAHFLRSFRTLGIVLGSIVLVEGVIALGPRDLAMMSLRAGTRLLLPLSLLLVARALVRNRVGAADAQRAVIVISAAALGALIQYPFAAPIYFLYVVPLVFLVLLAVRRVLEPHFLLPWVSAGLLALFAGAIVTSLASGYAIGRNGVADGYQRVTLPRAGIDMPSVDDDFYDSAPLYERLVQVVRRHASGRYIYAGPDAPEISFLSGYDNPTRAMYDFLAPGRKLDDDELLARLREAGVAVAVINTDPQFSEPISRGLREHLTLMYPHLTTVGRFEVRWRSA